MRMLSKLEFKTLYLYSKAQTFTNISKLLNVNSKSAYANAREKDLSRLNRAKKARLTNKCNYEDNKILLDQATHSFNKYKLTFIKNHLQKQI